VTVPERRWDKTRRRLEDIYLKLEGSVKACGQRSRTWSLWAGARFEILKARNLTFATQRKRLDGSKNPRLALEALTDSRLLDMA
jgi:hypothetical protein